MKEVGPKKSSEVRKSFGKKTMEANMLTYAGLIYLRKRVSFQTNFTFRAEGATLSYCQLGSIGQYFYLKRITADYGKENDKK